jgi:hypothetical protein
MKEQRNPEMFHRVSMAPNLCLVYFCSSADFFDLSCHLRVFQVHENEAVCEIAFVMRPLADFEEN